MEQGIASISTALIFPSSLSSAVISPTKLSPEMLTAWILVGVAVMALGIVVYVALRSRPRPIDIEKAVLAFRSLDIEAFRNLVNAGEEAYLRQNLPSRKFHAIKRQRAWAALVYTWEAGKAATALASLGQAAQRSSDPEIAASGIQLAENAFRLRLQTVEASLRLATEILWPNRHSRSHPPLVDQYERTAQTLFRLGRFSPALISNSLR